MLLSDYFIKSKGFFNVALPGGTSPIEAYTLLSGKYKDLIDWKKIKIFLTDERYVDKDDDLSNSRLLKECLINPLEAYELNFIEFETELPTSECAKIYQKKLLDATQNSGKLDTVFLGMGDDSHVASLFPFHKLVKDNENFVNYEFIDKLNMYRLSITPLTINFSEYVIIFVSGENKCIAVRDCLQLEIDIEMRPAQMVNPKSKNLLWILDQESAKLL